jgi:glycosyltransferase involved in cell wall biosynthesis
MLLKGRDIVIIGLQPWYFEIGSNCKNIALELAKNNRVLYVNTPINRKTFYTKEKAAGIQQHCNIIKQKREMIKMMRENLWEFYPTSIVESINWLPITTIFKIINGVNNRRFANDIKKAIANLGFKNIILFNDNDFFNGYDLKKLLSPSVYLYYCRDFLRGFDYWKKHGDVLEPEMINKADAAVANSLYLTEYCSAFNSNSFYIGQGCDLELFDAAKEYSMPDEMKRIASPIIGYVGALTTERLDVDIIEIIAKSNSLWNVVLVGPEDEAFKKSGLHQMHNVYFLGRKPLEQLPAFIRSFDVCINPQLINKVTIGNYPLKVDEYLAMGKPVVATNTKTMELFEHHTYLAEKPQDYPSLIEKALKENNSELQQKRIAFAKTHTWENLMNSSKVSFVVMVPSKSKKPIPFFTIFSF